MIPHSVYLWARICTVYDLNSQIVVAIRANLHCGERRELRPSGTSAEPVSESCVPRRRHGEGHMWSCVISPTGRYRLLRCSARYLTLDSNTLRRDLCPAAWLLATEMERGV